MPVYRQTYTWRDARGDTAVNRVYISAATLANAATYATALRDALALITEAANQAALGPFGLLATLTYGSTPAGDVLRTVEDKLVMSGQTALGEAWRLLLPAPLETDFLADGETGDAAAANVAALVAAGSGLLVVDDVNGARVCSRSGSKVGIVYGLSRVRRKTHRKFSLVTKDPNLAGPGL